ncbi:gentisate 1,2-dioxygenase [Neisseria animalis]|uniref:Gentisate 1,2-dioxygenase n=1 Tax=Neisseria animalis TaxID=492 RepID=A0A5P3MQQ0_NEIAN|nr:gentisate 1,2-dioxygenase [Neisseria animalis]QEY23858.1 gentisate 1,2-dioxygenase [Neisseria animalis]ROW32111.1 gentisate 1,2-dioxygenase [Neisseria animalis]VEE05725.1 Gentisate 1,2-dioxygenase [Neisseria animalis]
MSLENQRREYYRQLAGQNLSPLWLSLHNLVTESPRPTIVPAIWKYEEMRPYVMAAGELITAEEAVRRVLVLENPALPGKSSITQSLYAGIQLILPGETAPSHRHTQSALRFVLEGRGAWTAVNGERTTMNPGDFIITPSWNWHDHGNPSAEHGGEPVVWLDGLDIPLIAALDAGFAENNTVKEQAVCKHEGESFARFGYNMVPVRHKPSGTTSPIFSYPYERSREALDKLYRFEALDEYDGVKMRYINPSNGGWAMPTIGTFLQYLPKGFKGKTYRSSDSTVYTAVEGSGTVYIGEESFRFSPRDIFVVPSWYPVRLEADDSGDVVLFSYSDRPVLEAFGLLREARE